MFHRTPISLLVALCLGLLPGTASASIEEVLWVLLSDDDASTQLPSTDPNKPNASTTGSTIPLALMSPSGSITVTTPGTIIEGLHITGSISVKTNDVIIRNCIIEADSYFGIRADFGGLNLIVENVEITGSLAAGITGSDYTIRNSYIHEMGADAIKVYNNVLVENNFIQNLGTEVGSHADGIQMTYGENVTIRGNTINMPHDLVGYENSQCMIIQTDQGAVDNVLIHGNWLNGGAICVQINDKNFGPPTNVRMVANHFGRDHEYGTYSFFNTSVFRYLNRWEDTGDIIP